MLGNIKETFAAVLALTAAVHPSSASPSAKRNANSVLPDQNVMAIPQSSDAIQYGHCYKIKNQDNEDLGHLPAYPSWNYLGFGSNVKAAHFKVCQNLGKCHDPNRGSQDLWNKARFWLFDVDGNAFSPRGEFVAANSPPFGGNKNMYPGGGAYRYYVNFWVDNDCADRDQNAAGRCKVRLHIDNLRDDKGLQIVGGQFKVTTKDESIVVSFQEVDCPDTRIMEERVSDL